MSELHWSWRSVRVRITAAAIVVVGLAMAAASIALVAAVRHQLLDKLEAQSRANVKRITAQLADGVPPDALALSPGTPGSGFVTVQDDTGKVVKAVGVGGVVGSANGPGTIMVQGQALAPGETAGVKLDATGTQFDVRYGKVSTPRGSLTVFAGTPLDSVKRSVSTLEGSLAVGYPVLLAVVGVLAWFVTGRALHPVEAIRAEVEAITAGTLHRRVPEPDSGDEVSRLARTMNAMLDRLEHASDRQRQFVADASHELRSPVAAMRAQLEVGLAHPDATDWPDVARRALDEEGRLETLVTDLLFLASTDEQRDVPGASDVDLVAVAREEARRDREVPVAVTVAGDGSDRLVVTGRADRLGRVIANLLDNACRYARTSVLLAMRRDGDSVRLTVDDDGPGIAPEDRERVFERFTRLDPSRARVGHAGAGLGLALAKAIVEQHGGAIGATVASTGGARLEVCLPSTAVAR